MIGVGRRRGTRDLGRSGRAVPWVLASGLEVEPREPHAHGFRDMEGQRPVDRDEAVRDERPGAPVPGLDVGFREVGAFMSVLF